MLRPSAPDLKVYLHRTPIDLRRGRNGLAAMAREVMQKDPFSNTCFLFTNKTYSALKILAWDINGFSKPSIQDPRRRFRVETTLPPVAPMVQS
jgi:hypothetical protein